MVVRIVSTAMVFSLLLVLSGFSFAGKEDYKRIFGLFGMGVKECLMCDLRHQDFSKQKLEKIQLSGSFLYSANFSWSHLYEGNFESAQLTAANLEWSGLDGANFAKSNIEDATFFRASLKEADFRNVKGNRVNLSSAVLEGANLSAAQLTDADFSSADLLGGNLRNADLRRANFRNADVRNASFKDSRLSKALLEGIRSRNADFSGAEMIGVNLAYTHLLHVNFRRSNLENANFKNSILEGVSFGDSNLAGADFTGATFKNVVFADADLCGVIFPNGYIVACKDGIVIDDGFMSKPLTVSPGDTELVIALPGNMYADLNLGLPRGVMAEAISEVLASSSKKARYVVMSPADQWQALEMGDVDIVASVLIRDKVPDGVRYSGSIVREYTLPIGLNGNDIAVTSIDDLVEYDIGGREGYRYPAIDAHSSINLKSYPKDGDILRSLLLREIDFALISSVSDLNTFRGESIMHEFETPRVAVGYVDLGFAFSGKTMSNADIDLLVYGLDQFMQSARWEFIKQRNGIDDLIRNWQVVEK